MISMAKMNNSGLGISTMIGFIVVFILFIIVISILVYNLDHEKDSDIHLIDDGFVVLGE